MQEGWNEFMKFKVSKELYNKNVLLKTCYRFTDEYYIHLDVDELQYIIDIEGKEQENLNAEREFKNALIEFANREIVFEQTKNVRELLFARSMASSVLYDDDTNNDIDLEIDDENAMKDWFENV